jgi:acetylornithine deacetylase/succinyl-diaminopimelate desuccinylase-like protein
VIFLAEAGEEAVPNSASISWWAALGQDRRVEFSMAEGGHMEKRGAMVTQVVVTAAEKLSRNMKVLARGGERPRLGSTPDNPLLRLSAALVKLADWRQPIRLNDVTRAYFSRLAAVSSPEDAFLCTHLEDPNVTDKLRAKSPGLDALLRVTITPTIVRGGFRDNVIPATAEATLMVRPLPDEDVPALVRRMNELIDDPSVEVVPAWGRRPAAPPSGLNTEMFLALERVQKRLFPGAVTLPAMTAGTTDSAQLRAKGVQAYGIGSFGASGAHGNDERMSVEGLGVLVEFLYDAVVDVASVQ